ncbi:MAG: DUF6624 domain-containing protein [Bacteroidota bacterium]
MRTADQHLRKQLTNRTGDRSDEILALREDIGLLDAQHNQTLKVIIAEFGFPGKSKVGMDVTHAFWVLVMHQDEDVELQERVLEWMESEKDTGEVVKRDIAYLADRVAVNRGRCQHYGTQTKYDERQEKWTTFPICDQKKMKKLRKEMELMPFSTQMKRLQ